MFGLDWCPQDQTMLCFVSFLGCTVPYSAAVVLVILAYVAKKREECNGEPTPWSLENTRCAVQLFTEVNLSSETLDRRFSYYVPAMSSILLSLSYWDSVEMLCHFIFPLSF